MPPLGKELLIRLRCINPIGSFGLFTDQFDHHIGEKTEKNSGQILVTCHFYGPSLFLNIKDFIILSTSKKFYILQNGHKFSISDTPVSIEINLQWTASLCFQKAW